MKFTIRDLLWATIVSALLVCMSLQWLAAIKQVQEQGAMVVELENLRAKVVDVEELQAKLDATKEQAALLRHTLTKRQNDARPDNSP